MSESCDVELLRGVLVRLASCISCCDRTDLQHSSALRGGRGKGDGCTEFMCQNAREKDEEEGMEKTSNMGPIT